MFASEEKKKNKVKEGGGGRGKSNGKSNQMPTQILFALYIRLTKINTSTDEGSREKTLLARRVGEEGCSCFFGAFLQSEVSEAGGREEGGKATTGRFMWPKPPTHITSMKEMCVAECCGGRGVHMCVPVCVCVLAVCLLQMLAIFCGKR